MRRRKGKQLKLADEAQPSPTAEGAPRKVQAGPKGKGAKGRKKVRKPKGPARQTRWMRVLGLIIATGGGVVIGFGWAGAAQVDCVECQIPFLLSGGAAGIGLIIFGVSLLLLAQIRTESRRLGDRIELALSPQRSAPAPTEPSTEVESPAAASTDDARPEDGTVTPAPAEDARTDDTALTSPEPTPNPLSAEPVDLPATGADAESSDAATVAATTAAGGVVEAEIVEAEIVNGGSDAPSEPADATSPGEDRPSFEGASGPRPQLDQPPEVVPHRSDPAKRRRLFWRRPES